MRRSTRSDLTANLITGLIVTTLVALAAVLGPMAGLYAQNAGDKPADDQAKPQTLTEKLGGEDRYRTYLSTDKPIYRAGETVYVRGTILNAFDQTPVKDNKAEVEALNKQIEEISRKQGLNDEERKEIRELNQRRRELQQQNNLNPLVEIQDPKGASIASGRTGVEDSVFGFKWDVPEGQAGGEYTIKVTYPWSGLPPVERKFDIRAYRAPRIKTQIQFLKDGYGPGDTVVATLEATRAEGGIPDGAKVTAIARVDGVEVARVQTMVRETGSAEARFDLPGQIERGEGSLTFVIEDGGVVETASKTLPILLQTVDLALYPEGGDLVAGVENRVYFEARTPYGKPADIKGQVYPIMPDGNQSDFAVGIFETTHEGRGVFSFTPDADKKYVLKITEPSSVTQTFELPAAKTRTVAMTVAKSVMRHDDAIDIMVTGMNSAADRVVIRQREKEIVDFTINAGQFNREKTVLSSQQLIIRLVAPGENEDEQAGKAQVTSDWAEELPAIQNAAGTASRKLAINAFVRDATGILTLTAYDADGNPLAERLIYRAPKNQVNIEIMPDSAQYTPAGKVQLTIKTTDVNGKPVAAVAGLTVTDDSVLEMIDTREQAPMLPAMVFLEQEVQDLADAQVYLDPTNKEAVQQLDLLLGTQGWRRFALVNLEAFVLEHGDDARRMLALRKPVRREIEMLEKRMFAARGGDQGGILLLDNDVNGIPMPAAAALADGAVELEKADGAPGLGAALPEDAPADEKPQQDPAQNQALDLDAALNQAVEREEAAKILGEIARDEDGRRRQRPMAQMVFVREYAHKQPAGKPFGERSDFTETVYWSSATKTNDQGLATVSFDLSDSVTSFRVKADAFTRSGALGAGTTLIESVRPFYIEPKLPLELTAGDKVLLPIAMVNNTDKQLPVELIIGKLGKAGTVSLDPVALAADTRGRAIYELAIGQAYGDLGFNIEVRAGNLFDQNKRSIRVVPKGFPIKDGSGGMLNPNEEQGDEITIPESIVPGSLSASVTVYPTPLANLTEALEALIRDPYGCFEQTSSTTFPLVMAQQYFLTHQGVDPKLIATAREKLDAGYKRLIGFETEKNGYEWFGSTPPHEALTAYGLLQFNEMKDVMDVDQKMIDRTADWLMSRRDGKGSFQLDAKALDSFGRAPQETTNAYIVWSMLEAGYDPEKIKVEIDAVLKQATEGNDAYIVALGANIAQLTKRDEASALLKKLAGKLTDEGFIDGAVTSITNSGGDALKIETTSLAILAWLRDDAYTGQVEKSILWLTERCKAGKFGSTQSTVLALKAIVEYDKARSTPKAPGSLVLIVDGKPVGEPVKFDENTKGAIKLPDFADKLTPGKHTIGVLMEDGSKMPYTIAVDYFANTPASSDACKLRIETSFANPVKESFEAGWREIPGQANIGEGETTEVNVKITNITKDGLPTPIAIVGLPGGLEPSYDQLKELVKAGTIASFEVIGRDVVLYWREMKPEQVVELSIRCTAAVLGTYTGPASRAYLYYTDEHKQWADGLTVSIKPAGQ